jgi:hypothetical protein
MMYTSLEEEFWISWTAFIEKHRSINVDEMKYLIKTYIVDFRDRFVKIFINQVLHFDIIITSREEDAHSVLKRQLDVSTEDLKIVIESIDLLFMNEYIKHLLVIDNAKIRFSLNLKHCVYQFISFYVIHVVIRKLHAQYQKLTQHSTILSACIRIFIITTNLLCVYLIQKRLFEDEFLLLNDVHSHWR